MLLAIPRFMKPAGVGAGLLLALAAHGRALAQTRYVSPCGHDGNVGYTDDCGATNPWDRPVRTIQRAIEVLPNGGEIIVLPGTYPGGIDLGNKEYVIRGLAGAEQTTIDCAGLSVPGFTLEGPQHAATVIEGFTITAASLDSAGGGMLINGGAPVVRECVFAQNHAMFGGGVLMSGSSALIENCLFTGNTGESGAGLHTIGGSPTIRHCTFAANQADEGGGIVRRGWGQITIMSCLFTDNTAMFAGGAITLGTEAQVVNCIFRGNHATVEGGGAISKFEGDASITNCTFFDNSTAGSEGGGAILHFDDTDSTIIRNCILWADSPNELALAGTLPTPIDIAHCTVQGGYAGQANLNQDPMFINPAIGDLRLQAGSPCIDAGNVLTAAAIQLEVDFSGQPRCCNVPTVNDTGVTLWSLAIDHGAFESQAEAKSPSCAEDLAPQGGDGVVDVDDLFRVIGAWGACP